MLSKWACVLVCLSICAGVSSECFAAKKEPEKPVSEQAKLKIISTSIAAGVEVSTVNVIRNLGINQGVVSMSSNNMALGMASYPKHAGHHLKHKLLHDYKINEDLIDTHSSEKIVNTNNISAIQDLQPSFYDGKIHIVRTGSPLRKNMLVSNPSEFKAE